MRKKMRPSAGKTRDATDVPKNWLGKGFPAVAVKGSQEENKKKEKSGQRPSKGENLLRKSTAEKSGGGRILPKGGKLFFRTKLPVTRSEAAETCPKGTSSKKREKAPTRPKITTSGKRKKRGTDVAEENRGKEDKRKERAKNVTGGNGIRITQLRRGEDKQKNHGVQGWGKPGSTQTKRCTEKPRRNPGQGQTKLRGSSASVLKKGTRLAP